MTADPKGVIITGGTGFIGRHVANHLRVRFGDDLPIIALGSECNLEDKSAFDVFEDLSKTHICDHIFHLAARAPSGAWLAEHPADGWYSNTLINATLFEAARRYFPDARVTTALSYSMYPPGDDACTESDVCFRSDDDNLAAYANTKTAVLAAQTAYAQQYGMCCGGVVLPTVYGPNPKSLDFGQAVPRLCKKFLDAAQGTTTEVELWGSGNQERDFLFIDDAADGFIAAAMGPHCDLVNIGSGGYTSIRMIADHLSDLSGYDGPVKTDETQYAGPQRRWMSIDRANDLLGWRPKVTLRDGLAMTLSDIKTRIAAA